jgi:hypothetical protein
MTTILVAALLTGWAFNRLHHRTVYRCPACGAQRPDGHTDECPWSSRA